MRQAEELAAVDAFEEGEIAVVFANGAHVLVVFELFVWYIGVLGHITTLESLANPVELQSEDLLKLSVNLG